jgi:hypothetical protein
MSMLTLLAMRALQPPPLRDEAPVRQDEGVAVECGDDPDACREAVAGDRES